jgi:hypothetical protein
VDSGQQLIGLFTPENVKDLMLIQNALAEAPKEQPLPQTPPPLPNHGIN